MPVVGRFAVDRPVKARGVVPTRHVPGRSSFAVPPRRPRSWLPIPEVTGPETATPRICATVNSVQRSNLCNGR